VERWQEIITLKGHRGYIYSISFNPKGKFLSSGSGDATIKFGRQKYGKKSTL
jgi:WD40 repeat protein